MMIRIRFAAMSLTLAAFATAACGYALAGRGVSLPAHIKRIGVPNVINQTSTPEIDQQITEKLRRELQGRGKFSVVPESEGADAVLTCTIISVVPTNVAFTSGNQVSRIAMTVSASVEFRDMRDNKVLHSNSSLQFREEYDVTTGVGASDPTAFFGGNRNALERLAQAFAKSVVGAILDAF